MQNYNMLILSIVYIITGIFGLCGKQFIVPDKYDGFPWTKKYLQGNGLSWILLGVPWFILFLIPIKDRFDMITVMIILIFAALPSLAFSIYHTIKFKKILKRDIEIQSAEKANILDRDN